MKRIVLFFTLALTTISALSQVIHDDNGWGYYVVRKFDGLTYHMRIDYKEYWWNSKINIQLVRLYSADNNLGEVKIPSTVWYTTSSPYSKDTEHILSEIWDKSFKGRVGITSVSVPANIDYIGTECFMNCADLETVRFDSIHKRFSLWSSAFEGCVKLKEIHLPDSIIDYNCAIPIKTFKDCVSLEKIVIPKNFDGICENAFQGCTNLEKVNLSVGMAYIEKNAFNGCWNLKKIVSQNPTPPYLDETSFEKSIVETAILYVPIGAKDAYMNSDNWRNFFNIIETNELEDISDKKESVNAIYNNAKNIYNSFIDYYNGDAHNEYVAALTQQNDNIRNAKYALSVIDSLKTVVSESVLSDEVQQLYTQILDSISNAVSWQRSKNNQHYIFFNDVVSGYIDKFNAYNERLAQYKEQIEAATTNDDLDAIKSTIDSDMADMRENCLKPIEDSYAGMLEIIPILAEVKDELESLIGQIETLDVNISAAIDEANNSLTKKKAEAIAKYDEGMTLYNNFMEFDSKVRSAYDQLENQQNYNRKIGDEIEWEISELKGKVEASDFDAELKAYFLNVLDSVDNAKYGYVKWIYEYDYLIPELNTAKKEFESYAERLEVYKSSIESATTNAELDAIIEQMGIDNSNVGKVYRSYWETDYNSLLQFIDNCIGYEAELLKLLQRLKDLKTEFNNITSGIETIASTDGSIIVYTLNGERLTIKSSQVKSLPKGIYIINGKKYHVK